MLITMHGGALDIATGHSFSPWTSRVKGQLRVAAYIASGPASGLEAYSGLDEQYTNKSVNT